MTDTEYEPISIVNGTTWINKTNALFPLKNFTTLTCLCFIFRGNSTKHYGEWMHGNKERKIQFKKMIYSKQKILHKMRFRSTM